MSNMNRSKSISSWKTPSRRSGTSSSIRGKISNPIPMTTEDDEFPIRTLGAGYANPMATEGLEKQLPVPTTASDSSTVNHEYDSFNGDHVGTIGTAITTHSESDGLPAEECHAQTTAYTGYEPLYIWNSLASQNTRGGRSGGVDSPPLRKKSTLKSVVRRIFGRKRKSVSSDSRDRAESKRAGHSHHRSVNIQFSMTSFFVLMLSGPYCSQSKSRRP